MVRLLPRLASREPYSPIRAEASTSAPCLCLTLPRSSMFISHFASGRKNNGRRTTQFGTAYLFCSPSCTKTKARTVSSAPSPPLLISPVWHNLASQTASSAQQKPYFSYHSTLEHVPRRTPPDIVNSSASPFYLTSPVPGRIIIGLVNVLRYTSILSRAARNKDPGHLTETTNSRSSRLVPPANILRSITNLTFAQNQPHAGQQGLPPPNPLQYPRAPGLVQHHRPNSPHQTQNPLQSTSQGTYISPHSSTQSLPPQHQSTYVGSVPGIPQQHPGEATFFGAHPSPYSTNSAAGSYTSSGESAYSITAEALKRSGGSYCTR